MGVTTNMVYSSEEKDLTYQRSYYRTNRVKINRRACAYRRRRSETDPQYLVKKRAYERKYRQVRRKSDPLKIREKERASEYRRLYGLSSEEYSKRIVEQKGRCALCEESCKLYVDHCHRTQKIRALLCRQCNSALGFMKEKPELLEKAASYLRSFEK